VGFTPPIPKSLDAFYDFDDNNVANVSRLEVIIVNTHIYLFIHPDSLSYMTCKGNYLLNQSPPIET